MHIYLWTALRIMVFEKEGFGRVLYSVSRNEPQDFFFTL
jgi:hypothetical protein